MDQRILYLIGIMLLPNVLFGQIVNYYVVEKSNTAFQRSKWINIYSDSTALDTVHVMRIKQSIRENNTLVKLSYTDLDGKSQTLKNRPSRPLIISFCNYGRFYDRVPLHANRDNTSVRYLERVIDGELKCWISDPKIGDNMSPLGGPSASNTPRMMQDFANASRPSSTQYGRYHFTVQLPNKEFIDIADREVYESKLLPILEKCEPIQGEVDSINFPSRMTLDTKDLESELLDIIREYNEACAQEE